MFVSASLAAGLMLAIQATPAIEAAKKPSPKDPNRIICRTAMATGSRVKQTKECHTAAEWTEMSAIYRRDIERSQANRYNGNQ